MPKINERYKDLKFAKNWKIDEENESATHKSGLRIEMPDKIIISEFTGKRPIYFIDLPDWKEKLRKKGKSEDEILDELDILESQFLEIHSRMPEKKKEPFDFEAAFAKADAINNKKKIIEKNKAVYQNAAKNKFNWRAVSNLWKSTANIFKKSKDR